MASFPFLILIIWDLEVLCHITVEGGATPFHIRPPCEGRGLYEKELFQ